MFFLIVGYIVWGIFWGFATDAITSNKGYEESWFVWGFFFGLIAFVIALTKQDRSSSGTEFYKDTVFSDIAKDYNNERILKENGWKCAKCGIINASYTGSCGCGNTKQENEDLRIRKAIEKNERMKLFNGEVRTVVSDEEQKIKQEQEIINSIKQYKELYDTGVITNDEFEKKKKELLG